MASVRYIILASCQNAGLYAQAGWESEAAAWIEKQGNIPCAYVGYRLGIGVAGYDNVSVVFGGNDARASLRRVRDELEKSLDFRSESETTIEGNPALVMTARVRKRVYNIFGGGGFSRPYMYFEAAEDESTVSLVSSLTTAPSLEYSTDGGRTWNDWQYTTEDNVHTFDIITLGSVGDRVYLRGYNPDGLGASASMFSTFDLTGSIKAGGNVMSLLDKTLKLTEVPTYGFYALFDNASVLITPPIMATITAIGANGCLAMYRDCLVLTNAADMPALTTIGANGCPAMYRACSALTNAAAMPSLTTIGDYGCNAMYQNCTSLTAVADMPSLTTIGVAGCAAMYSSSSITAAADMPALTTIGNTGCSGMFYRTPITAAADMPSLTTIGNDGCKNIYVSCTFDMSDDGETLNFAFPTPPITAGETTYSTAYDVANWMGNTNGFTNH